MSRFICLIALICITGVAATTTLRGYKYSTNNTLVAYDQCNGDDYGTSGQFDFYVLAQSWSANFCNSHSSFPGCENPTQYMQNNLTMHGLWPNYNKKQDGHDWPQCCSSQYPNNLDPTLFAQLMPMLQLYWPNEQNPNPSGSQLQNSLWAHEWQKHGTCSGLNQSDYFTFAVNVLNSPSILTPSLIANNIGGSVDTQSLENHYTGSSTPCQDGSPCMVGLFCNGKSGSQSLEQINTCWDQNGNQLQCPWEVLSSGKQCSDDSTQIDSFNSKREIITAIA